MSEREYAKSLIDEMPAYQVRLVTAFIQGMAAEEKADDEFCESLVKAYEEDPDPHKADGIPLEDCLK